MMLEQFLNFVGDDQVSKLANELVERYPLLQPEYIIFGITFYVLSIVIFQPSQENSKLKKKANGIKKVCKIGKIELSIFIHNLSLAIYSIISFIITITIFVKWMSEKGFIDGICEFSNLSLSNPTWSYWNHLFYLSKYYEFIDTWIIIKRGRKPSFLQIYHHIGAVIGMWLINITGSFGAAFFTIINSFIHSIMYTYFAFSVIGYKFPFKSLITKFQLIQFIVGCIGSSFAFYNAGFCTTFGEKLAFSYNFCYCGGCLYLFSQFYIKAYIKKHIQ